MKLMCHVPKPRLKTPQELEEDPDMRQRVALYRDPAFDPAAAAAARGDAMQDSDDDDDGADVPEVCHDICA